MFKTIPIIVMAALCLNFNSRAQSPQTLPLPEKQAILGKVVSAKTGEALPGAVIKIMTPNHTTISNDKGEFILTLSNGTYNISISHLSYKTKNINIQIPLKKQLIITLETDDNPNKTKEEQLVQNQTNIKPLKIGDTIPEEFWNQNYTIYDNGKITTKPLSSYRNKLLVLDFWASWCTSCRSKFFDLKFLKERYGDRISVLLISSKKRNDNTDTLIGILEGSLPPYREYKLPTILRDETLTQWFPHQILPTYVWIFNDKILGITSPEFIGENVIREIFKSPTNRQTSNPL